MELFRYEVLMKLIPCSSGVLLIQLFLATIGIGGGHYFFKVPKVDLPSRAALKRYSQV